MRILMFPALAAALLASACSSTPPDALVAFNPVAKDPSDPGYGIRRPSYSPVVAGYNHRRPTNPDNWREMNDRLSPANKGAGS